MPLWDICSRFGTSTYPHLQVLSLINRLLMGESFRAHRSRLRLQRKTSSYGSLGLDSQEPDQFEPDLSSTSPDLAIPVYSVVPLSTDSGIIEWVSGSDTVHSLIKTYRKINNISLSLEHDLLKKPYAKYEELPLLQKVRDETHTDSWAIEGLLDRSAF